MIAIMSDLLAHLEALPSRTIEMAAGELLFRRDDEISFLFVIEDGLVHLVRHQMDGTPTVMQRAGPREIVAEASLFGRHYHCDAVATRATILRRMPVEDVRRAMRDDPAFSNACAQYLAHEVQRTRIRCEILGMRTVSARLDAWLTLKPLPPKGDWGALADDIGVTREALYRELARRRGQSGCAA